MIEIIRDDSNPRKRPIGELFIDGKPVKTNVLFDLGSNQDPAEKMHRYQLGIDDVDVFRRITEHSWNEIASWFTSIEVTVQIEGKNRVAFKALYRLEVSHGIFTHPTKLVKGTYLPLDGDAAEQAEQLEYCLAFRDEILREGKATCTFSTDPFEILTTMFMPNPYDDLGPTDDQASVSLAWIDKAVDRADAEARRRLAQPGEHAVTVRFNFPESVRVSCEQYLQYFGQFLKDVGVEATTSIGHDAREVLFTVTPDDPGAALDKIRTALAYYLRLPSEPAVGGMPEGPFAIQAQRLEAQVYHLQGDLRLANALNMTQATTIAELVSAQVQPLKNVTPAVLLESAKPAEPPAKADGRESLFGGLVKVGEVELFKAFGLTGVSFDAASLIRRVREYMGEPEHEEPTAETGDFRY